MTPETRKEKYLAKASGDYSGELPEPVTREEKYLFKIAESGGGGGGDSSEYAHSLELTINSQTYVLTATLKNTSGEALGTPQTIDFPLETMVVGGSYDDTTKKVILTLKNGNTVDFSVADLVEGLQSEITSSNKLDSDLVDDTNQNNKFVTSTEKTKIANALTAEVYNAGKQVKTGNNTGEIFNKYGGNKATGNYSHAEGNGTTASGGNSHAEGSGTTASGDYSHAEGFGTKASSSFQHVQGKYNVEDSNSKYAFIIGNGTANNNRSNALAVDWEGKIYINNSNKGADVSAHDNALVELIDSGQKNLASVNSGTFTAPTTPDGARYVSIPVTGVSGDVVLYMGSLESDDTTVTTCGLRLQFADGTTQTIQINRGNNIVTNISLSGELDEIGVYPANGYTASAGKSLSFQNLMLCSKAAWDISQNYVPYRPSYDELVARITALENA